MAWKGTSFWKKNLTNGRNILKALNAKINTKNINYNKIKFINTEIPTLEPSTLNIEIISKLYRDDKNEEEKAYILVDLILQKYSDLFYQEGEKLTHTHNIKHQITTKTDKPVSNYTWKGN